MLVGATRYNGVKAEFSNWADWMTTFAPGESVDLPGKPDPGNIYPMVRASGTSFGKASIITISANFMCDSG